MRVNKVKVDRVGDKALNQNYWLSWDMEPVTSDHIRRDTT